MGGRNRSRLGPLAIIAAIYAGVLSAAMLAERFGGFAAMTAALVLIAGLQNHLQILLHDGAHFQLHPRRAVNDLLADLFCGIPFLSLVGHYRKFHFEHHRYLGDPERDPERGFYAEQRYLYRPLPARELARVLLLDACGYHYAQFFVSYFRYVAGEIRAARMAPYSKRDRLLTLAVWGVALTTATATGTLRAFAIYWLLPQPTLLFLLLKLQGYGEHAGAGEGVAGRTLFHRFHPLVRFFIYPLNSDLHLEHHLNPALPWYRLEAVHRDLVRTRHDRPLRRYFLGRASVLRAVLLSSR